MFEFKTQKPSDHFLSTLVDYYFFVDVPLDHLPDDEEFIIPFPRITFGYFFDHPFEVTNHDLGEAVTVDMIISKISTHKISVQPITDRIKIIGAHVKPYTLAFLIDQSVSKLPWLIQTEELFGQKAIDFRNNINACSSPTEMFEAVETIFRKTLKKKDLSIIVKTIDEIEKRWGDVQLSELAEKAGITDRALREQFHKYIGCSPKTFIQLVQLKKSVFQMKFTDESLSQITYQSQYADQAHFIHSVKKLTGKAPGQLRKEMPDFRFLQF